MSTIAYESGNAGELVSLGGVKGGKFKGRKFEIAAVTIPNGTAIVVPDNPMRISLLVENTDSVKNLNIGLAGSNDYFTILPGGTIQIDKHFPFTGALYSTCPVATSTATWAEVSVQP